MEYGAPSPSGGLIFTVYLAGAVRERRSLRGIAAEPAAAGHLA